METMNIFRGVLWRLVKSVLASLTFQTATAASTSGYASGTAFNPAVFGFILPVSLFVEVTGLLFCMASVSYARHSGRIPGTYIFVATLCWITGYGFAIPAP